MKLFKSFNNQVITEYRKYFYFFLPGEILETKTNKFVKRNENGNGMIYCFGIHNELWKLSIVM